MKIASVVFLLISLYSFLGNSKDLYAYYSYCSEKEGLKICIAFHGSSSFAALVPEEKIPARLDIIYVRVENNSSKKLTISPDQFSCVNLVGDTFAIDLSLYDKIKWAGKLIQTVLEPGQKTEGYIFCPWAKHPLRTIVYQGSIIVEVSLF
ncbi:MAG: DUF4352 domain-containing protein [Syntrophobacterales bacterium]|nr:DUF4352 domain-containing protein [Syntrophobacterales bacterium]